MSFCTLAILVYLGWALQCAWRTNWKLAGVLLCYAIANYLLGQMEKR